jgi:hypothetical protein
LTNKPLSRIVPTGFMYVYCKLARRFTFRFENTCFRSGSNRSNECLYFRHLRLPVVEMFLKRPSRTVPFLNCQDWRSEVLFARNKCTATGNLSSAQLGGGEFEQRRAHDEAGNRTHCR